VVDAFQHLLRRLHDMRAQRFLTPLCSLIRKASFVFLSFCLF
jgi:hypothetical protein